VESDLRKSTGGHRQSHQRTGACSSPVAPDLKTTAPQSSSSALFAAFFVGRPVPLGTGLGGAIAATVVVNNTEHPHRCPWVLPGYVVFAVGGGIFSGPKRGGSLPHPPRALGRDYWRA